MTPQEAHEEIKKFQLEVDRLTPIVKRLKKEAMGFLILAWVMILAGSLLSVPALYLLVWPCLGLHAWWSFRGIDPEARLHTSQHMIESLKFALQIAPYLAQAQVKEGVE